jgi:hypothetical protein
MRVSSVPNFVGHTIESGRAAHCTINLLGNRWKHHLNIDSGLMHKNRLHSCQKFLGNFETSTSVAIKRWGNILSAV